MKTQFFRFLVLSFAFVVFSISAFAQSGPLTVEIPFNFHVGNERISAGKYELKRISTNSFLLRNESGSVKVLAQTPLTLEDTKAETSEKLVFNRYGDKYFLRQIFATRNTVGRGLYESKTEKMTKEGQQNNEETAKKAKAEQVAVKMKAN